MGKLRIQPILFILIFCSCSNLKLYHLNENSSNKSVEQIVEDKSAIQIAEILLFAEYGKKINKHKPFQIITSKNETWNVFSKKSTGGPFIELNKKDCSVIRMSYGK